LDWRPKFGRLQATAILKLNENTGAALAGNLLLICNAKTLIHHPGGVVKKQVLMTFIWSALCLWLVPVHGQERAEPKKIKEPSSHFTEISPEESQMELLPFLRRATLPNSPTPTAPSDDMSACPSGIGQPCALLGGVRYYGDPLGLNHHQASAWEAMRTPGMLVSIAVLFGSTFVDLQGSQACIETRRCVETNPLIREHSLGQKYAVAMPINAFATWAATYEKRRGRGVLPFFAMWGWSAMHTIYGVEGFRVAGCRSVKGERAP
jgi:hypothetical protein